MGWSEELTKPRDVRDYQDASALTGDPSVLADVPDDSSRSDLERVGIRLLGSLAKAHGKWVGASIMSMARVLGEPGQGNIPTVHPAAWIHVNHGNVAFATCRRLSSARLAILRDGYVYPTQALVDLIMGAPRK